MKIYSYLLFPAALSSLVFTTSVKAEEVSAKAADLIGSSANLLAQSSDPGFTPVSPTTTPSTPLYTPGGDVNPDLPASNYWYGSLSAGFGSQSDVDLTASIGRQRSTTTGSFNNAFSFNGAVGYQFEQFRGELEIGNRFFSVKEATFGGDITATTILINGYYDVSTGSKLRPYVGVGFGLNVISGEVDLIDLKGTSFAYQGKAGVQYEISRKGNIFAELKYGSVGGYRLKDNPALGLSNADISSSNSFGLAVGYRQGF
ncbi:P44/Msp2 family outer membrane protein [Cylindrospermopsis raciborskii]|uniref:Msp4/OMP-like domain-containing protein n=1 Tax=Cylindrospermopsis raciborskii CENA302 TaxID=1170768 RepID=A0A9Q5QYS3_9CYAN|nr:P44/Msp2 family outer membrane protein [Cylindrospermopsis raciborskii]NLQ03729.1 P44/Msp2 family outer membrane protein [Cylindrospermopsis raciborskii MVCC19]OHY33919.1 hypothetical protein BCV64_06975 [Cylindrospermopsis raciborskii MVCC14]OPH11063.1 hypothetical protein CENA302_02900 [Cylindrospermopsis raciborskii CENA302]